MSVFLSSNINLSYSQIRKRLMDLENELTVAEEERIVREFGMDV